MSALAPGSVIGILGGGQLGRLLAIAAAKLGFSCHIYCPEPDSPAFAVAASKTLAPYDDQAALARFGSSVDVITSEFENVPAQTANRLAAFRPVRPSPRALAVAQDRLIEKEFASRLGLKTARFAKLSRRDEAAGALAHCGMPALLKTRRFGYDGKGQCLIERAEQLPAAIEALGGGELILEERVVLEREISVILARSLSGETAAFDVPENRHEDGILRRSSVPASIPEALAHRAQEEARRLAEALDYVGVLTVEFFVARGEGGEAQLLFNECAPRVHNSGHWTLDACAISQFEQHVRAIAGWPLGAPQRHSDAVMENLIGDDAQGWLVLAQDPQLSLYLYGKSDTREGRKMGHFTRLTRRP